MDQFLGTGNQKHKKKWKQAFIKFCKRNLLENILESYLILDFSILIFIIISALFSFMRGLSQNFYHF